MKNSKKQRDRADHLQSQILTERYLKLFPKAKLQWELTQKERQLEFAQTKPLSACKCPCHLSNSDMMHFIACCGGLSIDQIFILEKEVLDIKEKLQNYKNDKYET